ncbi:MAG: hypothetical protein KC912_15115 [Proteobacteria bacterium]|nr:hypothetical protein [Pseudomonadota bacterium]
MPLRSSAYTLALLGLSACSEPLRFEEVWAEADGALVSVWGSSAEDVWTVGGQIEDGGLWRGSEDQWEAVEVPEVGLLNWVHGSSADDVWIGGIDGALLHVGPNGVTDHSLGVEDAIWGVLSLSPTEAYAVGGSSAWGGASARAWHFDGSAWAEIVIATTEASSLFKVALVGDEVWLIGAGGLALVGRGDSFATVPTGTSEDLVTVAAVNGQALIVGGRVTGSVFLGDADGLDEIATAPSGLFGVQDLGDGQALISGVRGYLATVDLETGESEIIETPNERLLHAVWSSPGAHAYAVGGNLESSTGPYSGTLLVARAP